MSKKKKEEIVLEESNVDLTKPLEEQVSGQVEEEVQEIEDIKEEETETGEEKEEEIVEVVDLDNKPIAPVVVEETEEVPTGFVQLPTKQVSKENEMKVYNGRMYKVLKNNRGMWADTGATFDLSIIK